MAIDTKKIYCNLVELLDKKSIKHDIHHFESGAVMIDIWIDTLFFVVQLDNNSAGISKIDSGNPGFDTKPDELFYENEKFMRKFESIFRKDP